MNLIKKLNLIYIILYLLNIKTIIVAANKFKYKFL